MIDSLKLDHNFKASCRAFVTRCMDKEWYKFVTFTVLKIQILSQNKIFNASNSPR